MEVCVKIPEDKTNKYYFTAWFDAMYDVEISEFYVCILNRIIVHSCFTWHLASLSKIFV